MSPLKEIQPASPDDLKNAHWVSSGYQQEDDKEEVDYHAVMAAAKKTPTRTALLVFEGDTPALDADAAANNLYSRAEELGDVIETQRLPQEEGRVVLLVRKKPGLRR